MVLRKMIRCSLVLLFFFLIGVGCRSSRSSQLRDEPALTSPDWQKFEAAWDTYLARISQDHPYELQGRCKPILSRPQGGNAKGVAVFFHGFTACPMQFIPFAERLSALGYYVIIPLLPGQGRAPIPMLPSPTLQDDGTRVSYSQYYGRYLPTDPSAYEKFIKEINTIVSQAPGRHVVGGLSVGGAMANLAPLLAEDQGWSGLYDEALAISPYFGMPGLYLGRKPAENFLRSMLNAMVRPVGDAIYHIQKGIAFTAEGTKLEDIPVSFGQRCYDSICGDRLPACVQKYPHLQASGGRDAICDFRLIHIATLEHLGASIQSRVAQRVAAGWMKTKLQIVGTEYDSSADTSPMVATGKAFTDSGRSAQGHACLYPTYQGMKIGHVIFDLTEQPFAPMPWRKSFMDQAVTFLDQGTFFAASPNGSHFNCLVPYE